MKPIPETQNAPVLRTDFSDPAAWTALRAAIQKPAGIFRFRANVDFVDDPEFADLTLEQVISLLAQGSEHTFLFIVDRTALTRREHPILVVDLFTEPGRSFRVIPAEMWSIENNLSIGNMDFEEFADAVAPDGIFRGFPHGPFG